MDMTLAPVTTTGSVQSTVIGRRFDDGTNEMTLQESVAISAASYIWQPWFVQVNGNAELAHDMNFGDRSGSSFSGSANATFAVLPMSKYPANLGFSHFDSRASGEFGGSDFIRDRVFINARAVFTQNLRGGILASWDRADQADSGIETSQTVNLDLNQTFPRDEAPLGITSIGLNVGLENSDFTATDPDEDDGSRQVITVQLNTRSEPFENVFYDSLITAIYDDEADGDDTTTRQSLQGVSTLQWRPEDEPFIVTGTLRTLTEKIEEKDDAGSSDSDTILANGTLGLRWPVNDRFSFNLGLRGTYEDVSRDEGGTLGEDAVDNGRRFDASFLAGANYVAEIRPIGGFDWRWDARVSADNGLSSDDGLVTRESIGLGHRFERMFEDLIFVPVRFTFAQDVDLNFDPNDDETINAGLSDSIAFSYSGAGAAVSTFARLFLRDTRNVIGEQREFQTIQARLGRRVALDRERRVQGDLSAQASREVDEGDADLFLTASGNFGYSHRNLFEIENLGLRSELRINIVNIEQLFGRRRDNRDDELLRNDWRNVVSYRIGRLTTSLEATAFHRDEGIGFLGLLRLRRDFGGGE